MTSKLIELNKCISCFRYCGKGKLSSHHLCPKCQENLDNKLFVEKAKKLGLYEKIAGESNVEFIKNKDETYTPLKKINAFSVTKYLKEVLDKPLLEKDIDFIKTIKMNNSELMEEAEKYIGKKRKEKLSLI